jgi:Holliday junction resolvase
MLEKEIERKLKAYAEKRGCLFLKFTSPGRRGVSDRVVIGRKGHHLWLELKAPGKKPTDQQTRNILRLMDHGADARWTDNLQEGMAWVDEIADSP